MASKVYVGMYTKNRKSLTFGNRKLSAPHKHRDILGFVYLSFSHCLHPLILHKLSLNTELSSYSIMKRILMVKNPFN